MTYDEIILRRNLMVSRASNQFRRHVEECLVERDERERWLSTARTITRRLYPTVTVCERDWRIWGHLPPGEWLADCCFPLEPDDWEWDDDDVEEDDWEPLDYDLDWDDAGDDIEWQPAMAEFGGRLYPREHVEDATGSRRSGRR